MTGPWLSVLTTPRRLQYLRGTLDAIDAAGGAAFSGRRIVSVDGAVDLVRPLARPGWDVESLSPASRGTRKSMWEILHRAAGAAVPFLLYFEDDVRLTVNAIAAMERTDVPAEYGFLSFFQMNKGMPTTPGIHRYRKPSADVSGFWGSQCMKIPARSLAKFAGADPTPPRYQHACDVWIGEQLVPGIVLPSIVRHVGVSSSIPSQFLHTISGDHIHRAGLAYAGDDADALQVLAHVVTPTPTPDRE
jgi:hypothetical protein